MDTNITSPPPTYSRTFYVWWFALFTLVSMAMNGTHAFIAAPRAWAMTDESIRRWLEVGSGMPTWFAVTAVLVSQIPPVALACATNALVKPDPNTTSGRGTAARSTTWTIAGGAFVLSAIAMTDLTRMLLGVPLYVAAIMPVIVDVSIVAAVLRLEIRRRGHAIEAHVEEQSEQQESPLEQPIVVHHEASAERPVAQNGATHEPPVERPAVTREPRLAQTLKRPVERFTVDGDAAELATRIAAETTISQPVTVIAEVLTRAGAGESQRKIATAMTDVSATTAGRICTAARELSRERELIAV